MKEIYHKEGVTLKFAYWFDPGTENEDHMTELTAFGNKNKISKIEKELSQPLCTLDKNQLMVNIKPRGHSYVQCPFEIEDNNTRVL